MSFHKIGEQSRQLEHVRTKRLTRATEVMKGMVVSSDIREVRNKDELLNLLPVILDTQVCPAFLPSIYASIPDHYHNY